MIIIRKKLFFNGTVYTMQQEGATVEAFITEDGLFRFVGSFQDCIQFLKNEPYEKIDLQGNTVLPGFIDSHLHLIGYGDKLEAIDLSSAQLREDVHQLLKAASSKREVILAEGFHEDLLSDGAITKADLDHWFPNQPVVLIRRCYHTILMNNFALQKWQIQNWDVPEFEIGKDINGQLNGYIYEGTMEKLRTLIKTYPLPLLEHYIESAIRDANTYGITSLVTEDLAYYGDWELTLQAFQNVLNHTSHPSMKLHLLVHHSVWQQVDEKGYFEKQLHPHLSFDSIKFFLDGSLGSRTAYLKTPYSDDSNNYGICTFTKEQLEQEVQKARSQKRTVAFHMIGDAAFEMAVSVLKQFPPALKEQKDRLIHLSMLSEDGIEKLNGLPVVLDLQPIFYSSDHDWMKDRIGSDRLNHAYLLRSFVQEGFICGGSSDAPIETINPWKSIFAAIQREPIDETHTTAQTEALTLYEAISLYTKGSAQTIASKCGEIRAGYAADFQLYAVNPFHVSLNEIPKLKPAHLFVSGEPLILSKK